MIINQMKPELLFDLARVFLAESRATSSIEEFDYLHDTAREIQHKAFEMQYLAEYEP